MNMNEEMTRALQALDAVLDPNTGYILMIRHPAQDAPRVGANIPFKHVKPLVRHLADNIDAAFGFHTVGEKP